MFILLAWHVLHKAPSQDQSQHPQDGWLDGRQRTLPPPMPSAVFSTHDLPHEGWIISTHICSAVVCRRSLCHQKWPVLNGLGRVYRTQSRVVDILNLPCRGCFARVALLMQSIEGKSRKENSLARRSLNDQSCEKDKRVFINKYLGVVFMVQPRQQSHHDAQDPGVHDHSIPFIHPAERGGTGYQISVFPCILVFTSLSEFF